MLEYVAENLLRLMAERGLSIRQSAEQSGLDERTIRAILRGTNKPQARTLHRLAAGLGFSVDELFLDPSHLLRRRFDRQTNPVVDEVMETHQALFAGWTEVDFDELHSRMGAGGALTFEGALAAVHETNRKRMLHEKLDLLLESGQADLIGSILEVLYDQIVVDRE
jgi:transcriptional regulator with XRE-family HTH domain